MRKGLNKSIKTKDKTVIEFREIMNELHVTPKQLVKLGFSHGTARNIFTGVTSMKWMKFIIFLFKRYKDQLSELKERLEDEEPFM